MSDNENIADDGDTPSVFHFLWNGPTPEQEEANKAAHADCHEDSPCRASEYRTIGAVGIRAVVVDGEVYLNREDVLSLLARTLQGYRKAHEEMHGVEGQEMGAISTLISGATINLLGEQLHRLTSGDGISLEVPDTIPADWLGEQPAAPVKESPIEEAIRKAKEATLEAQRAKEEGK